MAIHSREALQDMGFAQLGEDVHVSTLASFHGASRIALGDHVRIDDFCVLSAGRGGIAIGSHVHLAVFCCLLGAGKITLHDFSNLSSRVSVYSSNDDYSGIAMTNPTIPAEFTQVEQADVTIGRHVIIGSGSVILPGVTLEEGAAVGALSLVKHDCGTFGVYGGQPAKLLGTRSRKLLDVEQQFLSSRRP